MVNPGTVVITGASAGVGRATARAFAARGWNVALLARGKVGLDAAAAEVTEVGARALSLVVDVSDADAVFAAADQVQHAFGSIDVWINNAMATVFGAVTDISPAEFQRVTDVTYLGQVHGAMAALRHMRPANRGTIVQVGSALAYRSIPLQAAYCGAKAAVRGFTDSLRTELLHEGSGLRVTMVHLPAVNTPQFDWARSHVDGSPQPVPPIFDPADVAEDIVRAALTAPRELWVGKSAAEAIVGTMIAPGLMDRFMSRKAFGSQIGPAGDQRSASDNLFQPVETDFGAEGRFGARTRSHLTAFPAAGVRLGILAAGVAMLGAAVLAGRGRRTVRRR